MAAMIFPAFLVNFACCILVPLLFLVFVGALFGVMARERAFESSSELVRIASETKDFHVDDFSEREFYVGLKDFELVEVFNCIDKKAQPSRYHALILEIRSRVAMQKKQS